MPRQSIEEAAKNALGGPPTMPPAMPARPVGVPSPGTAAAPLPQAAPAQTPFDDGIPEEAAKRRQAVGIVRGKLSALMSNINREVEAVSPLLKELEKDASAVKSAEFFDCAEATKFLAALSSAVESRTKKK